MSFTVTLPALSPWQAWRDAARLAISHRIRPEAIDWSGEAGLFASQPLPDTLGPHALRVRSGFLDLGARVIWARDPARAGLLYQALWRLDRAEGDPLSQADPLGRRLHRLAKSVARDIHKMHAFVRFREVGSPGPRRAFAAWFEPEHLTLEPGSAFFAKRFADMDWRILTPDLSAYFTDGQLTFGPGHARPDLPPDATDQLWATYFANIFNPARVKLAAMRSEMPKKYWKNLPETQLIPDMLKDAEARVARMHAAGASAPRPGAAQISTRYRAAMPQAADLPQDLDAARAAAAQCRRCALCEAASGTVFGEGPSRAPLMIVGEQPGDREDLEGRPFIGPAGQLLRDCMHEAGIDPARVWLTNAVKHFKFVPRGKQRLHQTPDRAEIAACRDWLSLEIGLVRPRLILGLGTTAALALSGEVAPMAARRGFVHKGLDGVDLRLSWHPAHLIRHPDAAIRARLRAELIEDLRAAGSVLAAPQPG